MPTKPSKTVQTIPNPYPDRDYEIEFCCPEFTCLCPLTGQPDFATVRIRYIPDRLCVELKSLKLYLWSYRDERTFHEAMANRIMDDLAKALQPRQIQIVADFMVRGGIRTVVTCKHEQAKAPSRPRKGRS
ncbi:MAG: NADPH-dependent 7-cyano-7-deazaguanine reductase QueF [Candidatus Riflebacteria bacterium]|nr:NADPH-dependent 7-cyano-7-deazaguanine reductase QueF [Candidatus Riflebacteria bacterium]